MIAPCPDRFTSPVSGTDLRFLLPICLVATLGGLLFGYDTGVISGAIEALTLKFSLNDFMRGWVSGCVLIGCAFGVLVVGSISDRFGRKAALFLAAIMFLLSALGTALPQNVAALVMFRFLGGIGIGIASIGTPMYIAEIAPAHLRGRLVAVNQIAIVFGLAATAFINYAIAGAGNERWLVEWGWRWMFAAGIVPSALFVVLLRWIPESPRWLVERGRQREATDILCRVGGPEFAASETQHIQEAVRGECGPWAELLSARKRRPLFVGIALAVLQQVTGINVFLYFGATIFQRLSGSTGIDAGLLQQIIINGACVLFTVVAIATVDKFGRRPLMLIGATGMGVSLAAMGLMAEYSADPHAGMLGLILLYIACFGLSVGPVTWVILAEIFPTAVRGRALGLAAFFLWLADYFVTQSFPMMDAPNSWFVVRFHHAFPFYIYAGFCAVLVVVVLTLVPETKGKRLEDIERAW